MSKQFPNYLKLHVEDVPQRPEPSREEVECLTRLRSAFQRATGARLLPPAPAQGLAPLQLAGLTGSAGSAPSAPEKAEGGESPGLSSELSELSELSEALGAAPELDGAAELATAVNALLTELESWRTAVWEREAELAAAVPVVSRSDESEHLAARLESILASGAKVIDCQAAAIYILDDATSELKLRAGWGLPRKKLLEAARPLRGAVADLEALVGHAVVLEDAQMLPHWRAPEPFASAVCVPISSPSTPLGTLWYFCNRTRDFSAAATNLIEILAGRVAAELEREAMLREGLQSKRWDGELEQAANWQLHHLPSIHPLLEKWNVAGWTMQAKHVGGDFHDWTVLPDGRLALTVGDGDGSVLQSAMTAAALQAALKAHTSYRHQAGELLQRMNETLWTSSSGGQTASLGYATFDTETGDVDYALAGSVQAFTIRRTGNFEVLAPVPELPLGIGPDGSFHQRRTRLAPGDQFLMSSHGPALDLGETGLEQSPVVEVFRSFAEHSASCLVEHLRTLLLAEVKQITHDWSVVAVQREV